ncbi:hypothetical protein EB093_09190, partial [bacterium]|nr:hypothetical protein [bacterium]
MNVQYDWRFFLRNVFNHRSNILKVALFGSILSIGFSCVYQIKYEAVVKLHSREGSNPNAMMAGKFGGAAEFLSGGSVRNNNEFYMEILRTRPVLNRIIEANNLKNHYKVTSAEKAQKKLLANLGVVL